MPGEPTAAGDRPGLLTLLAVITIVVTVPFVGAVLGGNRDPAVTPSRLATDRDCPVAPAPEVEIRRGLVVAVPVGAVDQPATIAWHPTSSGNGVLGERGGRLVRVEGGRVTGEVLHDLTDDTAQDGDGGLLAAVYDPAGEWLYVYRTTAGLDDSITAFRSDATGGIDPAGARRILTVDREPSEQHHGGSMLFGSDGHLYIGLGDGGGLGDPRENAQDLSTILGKIIRIDPTPEADRPYRIPADNPYADRFGARPEIWASGVRNPFRITETDDGTMWLGDVGQSCWEEINRLTPADAGANLGWDRWEGFEPFEGGETRGSDHHEPVIAIPHSVGLCAIVVGAVWEDAPTPDLEGTVLLSDYCAGRIWALRWASGAASIVDLGVEVDAPVAITPGPDGAPWVLTLDGAIFELRQAVSGTAAGPVAATP